MIFRNDKYGIFNKSEKNHEYFKIFILQTDVSNTCGSVLKVYHFLSTSVYNKGCEFLQARC